MFHEWFIIYRWKQVIYNNILNNLLKWKWWVTLACSVWDYCSCGQLVALLLLLWSFYWPVLILKVWQISDRLTSGQRCDEWITSHHSQHVGSDSKVVKKSQRLLKTDHWQPDISWSQILLWESVTFSPLLTPPHACRTSQIPMDSECPLFTKIYSKYSVPCPLCVHL